ncbi:DUF5074 domain-containing protein [Bergeyella porcorum]|uniref:DUF5074 domain-containing protein n=1 Tax=Bergeyella porcorum TaxID=1735111 RepID=UPI0035EDE45C
MRKFYFFTLLVLFAFFTNAQITVQGIPRKDIKSQPTAYLPYDASFTMDDITYWVGEGENKAAFVVQWNDTQNPSALVWGFRWNGEATGVDMLKAIAKADARFYSLIYGGTQYGDAIGGLGFDTDNIGSVGLYKDGNLTYPKYPTDGIIGTTSYDFDSYTSIDTNDRWQSGWTEKGFWSYYTRETETSFAFSSVGASGRTLKDGSWDLWNFSVQFNTLPIATTFTPVSAYVQRSNFTDGYFVLNEGWFGHEGGTLNFIGNNGVVDYKVYNMVNEGKTLGNTAAYGTIYGGKLYIVSKQNYEDKGGRLIVADAKTLKKIASFDGIGGGDGRSFLGVNENIGYIGASNGIVTFDIANMNVGNIIPGTGGGSQYSGQIGNMIRSSQYVFAVKQNAGILIIDPKTHTLKNTIEGDFQSITQAKDGSIWAIQSTKLVNIHPITFTTTEYIIPQTKYFTAWGAWNAGSFTYSTQQNALYWLNSISSWSSGTQIVKFDITSKTFNENFATIPGQDASPKQIPYGAALRLNPISDELILTTTQSGWGANYQKNWIHTISSNGELTDTKVLNDYYWFQSMPVFPDNVMPTINGSSEEYIALNAEEKISLVDVVSDEDNLQRAIVKSIKSNSNPSLVQAEINEQDELVLTPIGKGIVDIVVSFNSNGQLAEKTYHIDTRTLHTDDIKQEQFKIYPNPATDFIQITNASNAEVEIYTLNGKLIQKGKAVQGRLAFQGIKTGVYLVKISTENRTFTSKLIVK